ncbi:MAG: nicotinate (nicotinamide) nucleotide adenylyltransferase [Phycisphaerae bacterium]|nr:nicotinate (nicotinamide) nucleotide adenylyltransferase [Phycisphaerae bacterium]
MERKKIVLFGGTFDPVHKGHVAVAAEASRKICSEVTVFLPAKRSPLKALMPSASDEDRYEMIRLAISKYPQFRVSDYELKKEVPTYTIDTVRGFKADFPEADLYWLVGADAVSELPLWYKAAEFIDECNLCVMYRGGFELPDFSNLIEKLGQRRVKKLSQNVIATALIDVSSTEIRKRILQGLDVSDLLDTKVAKYIKDHGLYRIS